MIIEITEYSYKGITLQLAKGQGLDVQGWMCNLGGVEYLFPHAQAAQSAIDDIFRDIKPVIDKHRGKKCKGKPNK